MVKVASGPSVVSVGYTPSAEARERAETVTVEHIRTTENCGYFKANGIWDIVLNRKAGVVWCGCPGAFFGNECKHVPAVLDQARSLGLIT